MDLLNPSAGLPAGIEPNSPSISSGMAGASAEPMAVGKYEIYLVDCPGLTCARLVVSRRRNDYTILRSCERIVERADVDLGPSVIIREHNVEGAALACKAYA